ncbi:MAG: TetR/AcrR family transcriptional regulator [Dyadobacter sp.]|uniref:TetR/AcrR family transcriptional regulator n=1 Tax=Dyadobacter sp. TaxID=1914288 RepID=UPI003263B4AD
MSSKISKAGRTRQFIIETTAPIINRKGYFGTSLSDIITATGLTKGCIYGNFARKDAIISAAFEYNLLALRTELSKGLDDGLTITEKLLAYPVGYMRYFDKLMENGGCPIQNTAIEADDTNPGLRRLVSSALEQWKQQIMALVASGIDTSEFRTDTDPEQVALTMIATIEGAVMLSGLSGKRSELGLVMDALSKLIRNLSKNFNPS